LIAVFPKSRSTLDNILSFLGFSFMFLWKKIEARTHYLIKMMEKPIQKCKLYTNPSIASASETNISTPRSKKAMLFLFGILPNGRILLLKSESGEHYPKAPLGLLPCPLFYCLLQKYAMEHGRFQFVYLKHNIHLLFWKFQLWFRNCL